MTQIYYNEEPDEEDRERLRFEKLNTSMQRYIREMKKARDQMLSFQENVMMKPFYMDIIQSSPSGSSLAAKITRKQKWAPALYGVAGAAKRTFVPAAVVALEKIPPLENVNKRKVKNRSFVMEQPKLSVPKPGPLLEKLESFFSGRMRWNGNKTK